MAVGWFQDMAGLRNSHPEPARITCQGGVGQEKSTAGGANA